MSNENVPAVAGAVVGENKHTVKETILKAGDRVATTCRKAKDNVRTTLGRATGYEQHIAVFGESGSGKTTLLSVFYGRQQSGRFIDESGYELLANDATLGNQLLAKYHQVQDNLIQTTRLNSTRYEFSIRPATREKRSKAAIRLVWHDYPGEWLTEQKSGEEDVRKKETFEKLVKADVAYFLVDASKLRADGGRYLKRVFSNFKDVLTRLHADYSAAGKLPFRHFPRLWFICLSKADLLPDWNVQRFKAELEVAEEEIANVERVLNSFVGDARNVDFKSGYLLLSSLKVNPDSLKIENWEETKGVDAIVPLSFFAPVFRSYKWAKVRGVSTGVVKTVLTIGGKVFSSLGSVAVAIASLVLAVPWVGWLAATPIAIAAAIAVSAGFLLEAAGGGVETIYERNKEKLNGLEYMLWRFQLKIIEIRNKAICEVRDFEDYVSQKG